MDKNLETTIKSLQKDLRVAAHTVTVEQILLFIKSRKDLSISESIKIIETSCLDYYIRNGSTIQSLLHHWKKS